MAVKKTKSATKASTRKSAVSGPLPPYGDPIRGAMARGNLTEMKSLAVRTRKYIAEVQRALRALEGKIAKHG